MHLRTLVLTTLATAAAAFAQTTTLASDSPYQIRYASNLAVGDSYVNISNDGANGTSYSAGSGTTAAIAGSICANVYVFTPDEEIVSCCSCPVTPNGLVSLSAKNDLISNPLTRGTPTSIVIKLVATAPVNNSCNNSAAAIATERPVVGMVAWGTTLHQNTSAASGTYGLTETAFTPATLTAGEINRLSGTCSFVASFGSGFGVCNSCRLGGLGSATNNN